MDKLERIKSYIEEEKYELIKQEDIKRLERELLNSYNDEICEVLGTYYGKTSNLKQAITISKKMYEKESYYYHNSVLENFLEVNQDEDVLQQLESIDEDYIHETLGNYYYCNGYELEDILGQFNKVSKFKNYTCPFNLANIYYDGRLTDIDYKKVLKYAKEAEKMGYSFASSFIGSMYYEGKGVEQDRQKGYDQFKKAIILGAEGMDYCVEQILENPACKDCTEDFIHLYQLAINIGKLDYVFFLGILYTKYACDYKNAYNCFKLIEESEKVFSKEIYENTLFQIGTFYLNGIYLPVDLLKACEYFEKSNAKEMVEQIKYYLGLNDKIDYKLVLESAKDSYDENLDLGYKELIDRVNNNCEVVEIRNIKELTNKKLQSMSNDSLIFLRNQNITVPIANCLYTYEDMLEILDACNDIVKDIDLNQNEEDIFMQVYIKLAERMKVAYTTETYYFDMSCFNLKALLDKGVCAGFSIVLQTILDLVGIECNVIDSTCHEFNQVKINNKWYYCDLYWDCATTDLDNCLKSKKDFCTKASHIPFSINENNDSFESFPNIEELYKKNLKKLYGDDYKEHDALKIIDFIKCKKCNN